ncbi:MAG: FGGY-family carbohydrate kinase [Lacrimispora sp.]
MFRPATFLDGYRSTAGEQDRKSLRGKGRRSADYESLAFKYRSALRRSAGVRVIDKVIHMVGGGTQSGLLCQMTANACGCRVLAGPTEATVLGNMVVQLMALGELTSLSKAREVIKNSVEVKVYEPQDIEAWDEAYETFKKISEKK